jgi:hypothetical protein
VVAVPATGVTSGFVAKLTLNPLAAEAESVTGEANVPEDCMVRVDVAAEPCTIVTVDGDSEMLKSPAPFMIWTPIFMLVLREPLVPTRLSR